MSKVRMFTINQIGTSMSNKKLENIAKKIIKNTKIDSSSYGIDPITILMVISIILTLIRIIQECKKNRKMIRNKHESMLTMKNDIKDIVLKDSWINRYRLQKIIKQNLSKEQYKVYCSPLQTSIMETGINLTEDEVITLMEAVQ